MHPDPEPRDEQAAARPPAAPSRLGRGWSGRGPGRGQPPWNDGYGWPPWHRGQHWPTWDRHGWPPGEPGGGPPWARQHWPDRARGGWPPGLAVVLAAVQVFGVRGAAGDRVGELDLLAYGLLLVGPLALILRRRWPLVTLAITAVAAIAFALIGYPRGPFFVALIVALVKTVRAGHVRAAGWMSLAGYLTFLAAGFPLADLLGVPPHARPTLTGALILGLILIVTILFSEAGRIRAVQVAEVVRARAEQARAREEQDRRQASEERLSIARELHDVIGHHLSLINVQAGVGLHLMDARPEQARAALTAIKSASAEALREVRAVLGALHAEDESAPRTPAPGLAGIDALAAGAGLPCRTEIKGSARPVPAEVDRAAYRIVQEALTNVRRHAGGRATVGVTVDYGEEVLTVRVENDDAGGDSADAGGDGSGVPAGSGIGIVGMRARAEALGGSLEAGPRPSGGYLVVARLPIRATAATSTAGEFT